jgi:hypothetical protein
MSTTYIANLLPLIAFVLPLLGLEVVDQGTFQAFLLGLAGALGTLYVFWGRYKAGGLTVIGLRKK